ncbi:TBC1 domain family member 10A, partial [Tetrabaena socialis]
MAAVLLLYMDAEKAFWTLVAIMQGPPGVPGEGLERLFTPGMPMLQCCLHQFKHLLQEAAPRLASRLEREGIEPVLFATHWFNTAFAYALPFGHLLRVWDVFVAEGIKTLFRVGLAVMQHAELRLLALPSFEALLQALTAKNVPALLPPSPEALMRRALRLSVSERLGQLRAEWQAGNGGEGGGKGAE